MSYRRPSPPRARDNGPTLSSSSRSYGSGSGGYTDRRHPSERDYNYDSRGSRRSRSPPRSKEVYPSRDRRDDRYDNRHDRDYPREAAPAPRIDRDNRRAGPPAPRHDDQYRSRRASPPRRAERDQKYEEERGREKREEAGRLGPAAAVATNGKGEEIREGNGDAEDGEVQEDEEADMMAAMGFGGFGTTKNSKVEGNQTGAAEVKKERTWRQYMSRKGGFNRPLSPVRKS